MTLSALWSYPIKSCGGVPHYRISLERTGLKNDRRWMLVDPSGGFLSQRTHPEMARIRIGEHPDALDVSCTGHPPLTIPLEPDNGSPQRVRIWEDSIEASVYPEKINAWFSAVLNTHCRLVHLSDSDARPVNAKYGVPADRVGFADAYPILLTTEASLADLNARLAQPVGMERFRPNIVIAGTAAFAEDRWSSIRIGSTTFRVVKPCTRCSIPSVDQQTGAVGQEPMRTLATFRAIGNRVLFGQNLIHDSAGMLETGVVVEVLEERHNTTA